MDIRSMCHIKLKSIFPSLLLQPEWNDIKSSYVWRSFIFVFIFFFDDYYNEKAMQYAFHSVCISSLRAASAKCLKINKRNGKNKEMGYQLQLFAQHQIQIITDRSFASFASFER